MSSTLRPPALVALSRRGAHHAAHLAQQWPGAELYLLQPWAAEWPGKAQRLEPPLRQHMARLFSQHNPVCFFCAVAVVVRLLAPHLQGKQKDPAVLAIDETARFVVPVLSGHLGGANAHALRIGRWLAALPVITTASDALDTLAVDLVGRELGWHIQASSLALTRTAACVVNGEPVAWVQSCGTQRWRITMPELPAHVTALADIRQADPRQHRALLWITHSTDVAAIEQRWPERLILYRPPREPGEPLAIGMGCDRGTPLTTLREALLEARHLYPFLWDQVTALATIDRKGDEVGLLQLADLFQLPLTLYPASRLAQMPVPTPSETVRRHMDTPSVAEAAALLAGEEADGELLLPKQCYRGREGKHVTLAIARGRPQSAMATTNPEKTAS
ncbi:MAG: cobalamin biosynthesis protein [Magnetococcales bacterium]|nr:cobalamin biosynthesis protein [Magnetococcales bacterium]